MSVALLGLGLLVTSAPAAQAQSLPSLSSSPTRAQALKTDQLVLLEMLRNFGPGGERSANLLECLQAGYTHSGGIITPEHAKLCAGKAGGVGGGGGAGGGRGGSGPGGFDFPAASDLAGSMSGVGQAECNWGRVDPRLGGMSRVDKAKVKAVVDVAVGWYGEVANNGRQLAQDIAGVVAKPYDPSGWKDVQDSAEGLMESYNKGPNAFTDAVVGVDMADLEDVMDAAAKEGAVSPEGLRKYHEAQLAYEKVLNETDPEKKKEASMEFWQKKEDAKKQLNEDREQKKNEKPGNEGKDDNKEDNKKDDNEIVVPEGGPLVADTLPGSDSASGLCEELNQKIWECAQRGWSGGDCTELKRKLTDGGCDSHISITEDGRGCAQEEGDPEVAADALREFCTSRVQSEGDGRCSGTSNGRLSMTGTDACSSMVGLTDADQCTDIYLSPEDSAAKLLAERTADNAKVAAKLGIYPRPVGTGGDPRDDPRAGTDPRP